MTEVPNSNPLAWKPLAYSPTDPLLHKGKEPDHRHDTSHPRSIDLTVQAVTSDGLKTFVIQCGPGNQTIKWLSLAAGQRYAAYSSSESFGQAAYSSRVVLPHELLDSNGNSLDPKSRIRDVLNGGDTIKFHFSASVGARGDCALRTNKFGVPRTACSEFSRKAFFIDSAKSLLAHEKKQKSTILSCASDYEIGQTAKVRLRRLSEQRHEQKILADHESLFDQMYQQNLDAQGVLSSDQDLIHAVIDHTNVDALCANDQKSLQTIHSVLVTKLQSIQDIFRYYAASFANDSLASMSLMEFKNCVLDMGVQSKKVTGHQIVAQVWKETNICTAEDTAGLEDHDSMDLDEFIESLVRIAKLSYADSMSYGEAFKRFVTEKLEPSYAKKTDGQIRTLLALPKARQLLGKNMPQLTLVYKYYSMKNEPLEAVRHNLRPELDFSEFVQLMQDSGLVMNPSEVKQRSTQDYDSTHDTSHKELTPAEVRQCFSMSQDSMSRTGSDDASDSMVFSEFLEVVARVAAAKWEDPTTSFILKLEMALEALLSVQSFIPDEFKQAHVQGSRAGRRRSVMKIASMKKEESKRRKKKKFKALMHTAIMGANYDADFRAREGTVRAPVGTVRNEQQPHSPAHRGKKKKGVQKVAPNG